MLIKDLPNHVARELTLCMAGDRVLRVGRDLTERMWSQRGQLPLYRDRSIHRLRIEVNGVPDR